jgi:hypothetical protein
MSAFERYAYLDHDGFERDSVADTIDEVQRRIVERINGLQRRVDALRDEVQQVDELLEEVQRDRISVEVLLVTDRTYVARVRCCLYGMRTYLRMFFNRANVDAGVARHGVSIESVLQEAAQRTIEQMESNARNTTVEESNARAIRAAFGQGGGPSNDTELNEALRQSMDTLNAGQAQAPEEEEEEPAAEEPIEETNCPICMEALTKTNHIVGKCGHQFHASCLCQNLAYSKACPCCRKTVM